MTKPFPSSVQRCSGTHYLLKNYIKFQRHLLPELFPLTYGVSTCAYSLEIFAIRYQIGHNKTLTLQMQNIWFCPIWLLLPNIYLCEDISKMYTNSSLFSISAPGPLLSKGRPFLMMRDVLFTLHVSQSRAKRRCWNGDDFEIPFQNRFDIPNVEHKISTPCLFGYHFVICNMDL